MNIIHVHPSYQMSKKFVFPLMEKEKSLGYYTNIVNFKKVNGTNNYHFDLRINNFGLFYQCIKFIFFIIKSNPDIVFCHNSVQSCIPLLLVRLVKVNKVIYFNHGVSFLGYSGMIRFILYFLEKINLLLAHETLTVSKEMKFYLEKIGRDISIINNGSACGIEIDGKINKRKNNFLQKKKLTITYIGRLKARKGIRVLLKLLEFFKNNKNINFLFCGFNDDEFFQFTGKSFKNLRCLGFVDNVSDILKKSDILILPSLHEGMPYSILEAMLEKTLIIGNNIPGIRSLIKDSYNGFLIKNNKPSLYISLITKLMNKEINVEELIYNSLKTIKKYNRSDFMLKYEKFLKRVKVEK